jgi:PAS domain S-box-containing protein
MILETPHYLDGELAEATMQDITAPKQVQEAQLASETPYRALFELAPVGIVIGSAESFCLDANHGMCQMLGFTRKELVGLHASEYVTEKKAIPDGGLPLDATKGDSAYGQVLQFLRKDGSTFEAETLTSVMPDGTRLEFIRDIAERQRKNARVRRLIDSNVQGVMFWNLKGDIASANEAFLSIVGYTREDLETGLIDRAAMTPLEYADLDRRALEELATKGTCTPFEKEYIRKDGTRVPVLVGAANFEDSPHEGVCFVLDITARKQAEGEHTKLDQHLRDQHFYTRSLIESNIDALMTTDSFAIITDVNRQMETLTGCTRDELIGAAFKSLFTEPERAEAGIKRVLREGKATNYELTVRARDGKLTVVSFNATTLYDRHRRLQGAFAAARDMTEHKKYEETLREATQKAEQANREMLHLNASLEQQVLERTATVESARRQLQESNERFAIAADSAGIGVWEFTVGSNSFTWDDWMYRIYGHTRGPHVEPYSMWVNSLHPEDRTRCEARFGAAVRGERDFDPEFRIVRPGGEIRCVRATSRMQRGADGGALTLTGVNLDVTELRRAQEAESIKRYGEC